MVNAIIVTTKLRVYGMPNIFKDSKIKKILKLSKRVLFTRFQSNLCMFLVVIIITLILTKIFAKPKISGEVVIEEVKECPKCPEVSCPQIECPPIECFCPEKIINKISYRYVCPNGLIVNKSDNCFIIPFNITSKYSATVNGISLSLDDVRYIKENDSIRIVGVNYTIINKGEEPILPIIEIRVYKRWTYKVMGNLPQKIIKIEKILNPNEGIKRSERTNIVIKDLNRKIRLDLKNAIPDPDEYILSVFKKLNVS